MKVTKIVPIIAGLGLALGAIQQARATADSNVVVIALNFVAQGPETSKTDSKGVTTYTSTVDKFRGGNKDLLSLIANAKATTFPLGAFLEIDGDIFDPPSVIVLVKDKTGSVLADVTSFFPVIEVTSDDIYAGKYNDTTYAETSTDYYTFHMKFDDHNGKTFDVSGFSTEAYKATPENANGEQTETDSVSATVSGTGTDGSDNLVVQGTIKMKGKSVSN